MKTTTTGIGRGEGARRHRDQTYPVVCDTRDAIAGDRPPLPVRADPELGVHLVLGDDFARKDMAHEEVVVHGLRDDASDGG